MNIQLKNIMPKPLASIEHGSNSIWGNKIDLIEGKRILLNASSGKGKSTITSILAGTRTDYEGDLIIDNTNSKEFNHNDWTNIRLNKFSFVFQDLQLFPKLTVEENLLIKNNLSNHFLIDELREMLSFLGIGEKWEQKCGLLSMGQQQRVAIIRALSQKFEWLIMDEPFSHLDLENTAKCMELIHKNSESQGAGFMLTTLGDAHDYTYDYELNL